MRRLLATTVLLAALGVTGIGHADDLVLTGTIQLGTLGEVGYSQDGAACDPAAADNGVDGVWFAVADHAGDDAELTIPDRYNDADVYFYKEDCTRIADASMAQQFIAAAGPVSTNTEKGKVPADTAFVLVNGFFGADIDFTLTIRDTV